MNKRENKLELKIKELESEIAELREVKNLLDSSIAIASVGMVDATRRHSIRGHAISIKNQTQLIKYEIQKSNKLSYPELLNDIELIAKIASKIIEEPKILLPTSDDGLLIISINDLLQERIKQLEQYSRFSEIQFKLDLEHDIPMRVQANPDWLNKGFDLLIENSAKAMESSPQKIISIGTRVINTKIEISIKDQGVGIPANLIPLLLHRPIPKNKNGQGLGIGLLMARMIFQLYKGDITLKETGPDGTVFTVFLPKLE